MKPLRVVFLTALGGATGGAEVSLLLLLDNLPPTIAPIVVSFEDGAYADLLRQHGFDVRIHKVSEKVLRTSREQKLFPITLRAIAECVRLAVFLRRLRPDAVHANSVKSGLIGMVAARLAGVPAVIHVRDMLEGPSRSIYGLIAKHVASECIAISRTVATWYDIALEKVIYNAVDLHAYENLPEIAEARASIGLRADAPVIGIVGRIDRWKGQDRFIRVVAALPQHLRVVGAIVGSARFRDDDLTSELKALVDSLNLNERILFVPWTNDVASIYRALDVQCNFSTREPFGRTMLEAAACGTPSVCFDDGGGAEIFAGGDAGATVVRAGDEAACVEAIVRLITDTGAMAIARAAATETARRFPIDAHALAVSAVLIRAARTRRKLSARP